jgi:hypothetical protein
VRGEFNQTLSVLVVATSAFGRWPRARSAPRAPLPITDVQRGVGNTGAGGPFPGQDEVLGSETIAEVRSRDLMVDQFSQLVGPLSRRQLNIPAIPRLQTGREVQR